MVAVAANLPQPRRAAGSPVDREALVRRPCPPTLLLFVLFVLLLSACTEADGSVSGVARMDEPLPRLAGETLDGDRVEASSYAAGNVLVINVWAHDCPPCKAEQPMLVDLAHRYENVRFLGVNYRDDRDAAKDWVREFDVPYPSVYDRSGRTAADLGYPFIPDTYVVDRGGTIRWVVFGATDEAELSGLIEDVLA
jgi:cytochrome c biogenesis protein CcmG, thiol:disulfide interchange protein DsbE